MALLAGWPLYSNSRTGPTLTDSTLPTLRTGSAGENMKDLLHVTVGGGGRFLRTAAVLTCAQVGRVPVRPVVLGVRLLVVVVVPGRLAEEFCQGCDVRR